MQKEQLFGLIDQLILDQNKYDKFYEYVQTFTSEPRCKKGCIAFVEEIYNLPNIDGKDYLAISLLSEKTQINADMTKRFILDHKITLGYGDALKKARWMVVSEIAQYIKDTSQRLAECELLDKVERQVYLRRSVARLLTIFNAHQKTTITEEQWSEVEPSEWVDYLSSSLDELTDKIANYDAVIKWGDGSYSQYQLQDEVILSSLRTYLNYLDTFLRF